VSKFKSKVRYEVLLRVLILLERCNVNAGAMYLLNMKNAFQCLSPKTNNARYDYLRRCSLVAGLLEAGAEVFNYSAAAGVLTINAFWVGNGC
jgi:hypothetical protein